MANIRVDLNTTIYDGMDVIFRTPCDCSEIAGIKIYYLQSDGTTTSKTFTLKDAHNNDISDISNLFASGVLIKVLLDVTNSYAYIQNADTNGYLERRFATAGDLFIESTDYPGCYYRYVNGQQEWVNPPMYYKSSGNWNAAYRTTERWNNKPVFVVMSASNVSNGNIPELTSVLTRIDEVDEFISIDVIVTTNDGEVYTLPYFDSFDSNGTIMYSYASKSTQTKYFKVHTYYTDTEFTRSIAHICWKVKHT